MVIYYISSQQIYCRLTALACHKGKPGRAQLSSENRPIIVWPPASLHMGCAERWGSMPRYSTMVTNCFMWVSLTIACPKSNDSLSSYPVYKNCHLFEFGCIYPILRQNRLFNAHADPVIFVSGVCALQWHPSVRILQGEGHHGCLRTSLEHLCTDGRADHPQLGSIIGCIPLG